MERIRVSIPVGEPFIDGDFQFVGAMEGAATDHSLSDEGEESFDLIQPGTAGGSEMEVKTLPLLRLHPALYLGAFVSAVVVHDEVNFPFGWQCFLQVIQEADELPAAVAGLAGPDHLAIENVEGGEQGTGAVSPVIMGLPFG